LSKLGLQLGKGGLESSPALMRPQELSKTFIDLRTPEKIFEGFKS